MDYGKINLCIDMFINIWDNSNILTFKQMLLLPRTLKIIKNYYELVYAPKYYNIGGMDKFLERRNLPTHTDIHT